MMRLKNKKGDVLIVDEVIKIIFEEGVENVYKRHEENTQAIIKGSRNLGLDIFTKEE